MASCLRLDCGFFGFYAFILGASYVRLSNFKQQSSILNKGSGLGDHDFAGQRMVNCHMLPSRIERCVATASGVGKRCCRRLWLGKFLFSYGKSFCFCHVVSPHPHGPPWWGSLERCKEIGKARQSEGWREIS